MRLRIHALLVLLTINSFTAAVCFAEKDSLFTSKKEELKLNNFFILTAGYRLPISKSKINNSGHGLCMEGGVNIGRLLSQKHVFGLFAGWGFMDKLWHTSFTQNFANDYGNSIKNESPNFINDSSVIKSSVQLIKNKKGTSSILPGCQTNSFNNYAMYYGIIIKLPNKYLPALKFYKGSLRSYFKGDKDLTIEASEYTIYELRRNMYGCELMFLNINQCLKNKKSRKYKRRGIGLSVYYENYDFYNSTLYFNNGIIKSSTLLKTFVSNSFLLKYKNDHTLGIKLYMHIM